MSGIKLSQNAKQVLQTMKNSQNMLNHAVILEFANKNTNMVNHCKNGEEDLDDDDHNICKELTPVSWLLKTIKERRSVLMEEKKKCDEPFFCIVDLTYQLKGSSKLENFLVFVAYIPSDSAVKQRMVASASLEGIKQQSKEQAVFKQTLVLNDQSDLTEENLIPSFTGSNSELVSFDGRYVIYDEDGKNPRLGEPINQTECSKKD